MVTKIFSYNLHVLDNISTACLEHNKVNSEGLESERIMSLENVGEIKFIWFVLVLSLLRSIVIFLGTSYRSFL